MSVTEEARAMRDWSEGLFRGGRDWLDEEPGADEEGSGFTWPPRHD